MQAPRLITAFEEPRRLALCLGAALALTTPAGALEPLQLAHRDERLEETVRAAQAPIRARFERAQLLAQVGHKLLIIGRDRSGSDLLERAETLADGLADPLLRDEAIAHLANEIASTDALDRAIALYRTVNDLETRTKLGWKLVNKLGKAGETARAQTLLDEMLPEVLAIENDLELRAELLAGTGASHRFTEAARGVPLVYEAYGIVQAIADSYSRGLFLNEIGANLMDVGHTERAVRVFERSRALLDAIESPLERARFLAMLGGEQAEKGQREAAARDLERGVQAAERIPPGEDRNDVMSELARNFGQSHRFERGIRVADAIPDPYYRAEGYLRIAKNLHRQARAADALDLLARTEALAARIESPYRRGIILRKLASEWIALHEPEQAATLLDGALAAAEAIEPVSPTDDTLALLSPFGSR